MEVTSKERSSHHQHKRPNPVADRTAGDVPDSEARLVSELAGMHRLHELSLRLIGQDNLDKVMYEVMVAAGELLGAERCTAQLLGPQDQSLRLVAVTGFDQAFADRFRVVTRDGFTTCAAALGTQERVIVEDLLSNPEFAELAAITSPLGIRAVMSTPLLASDGALLGLFTTYWDRPHAPDEHQLRIVDLYAQQAARQVERRRAEEALRDRQIWLDGQRQALEAAVNGAPLETSLGMLVRTAIQALGPDARAAFYLANDAGTALHHVVGMPDEYAQAVDGFKVGPDSLSCGLATATGRPVLTDDVRREPLWQPWLWMAEKFDFRACWSFPIHTAVRRFVGTLAIYCRQPRHAIQRDQELGSLLTHTASIIVSRHKEAEVRQQAEAALRESESRLETISNAVPALISYVDTDLCYVRCNDAYTSWFGVARDQIIGRPMREVLGEKAWAVVGPHIQAAIAGRPAEYEAELKYEHGDHRWVHAAYRPDLDAAGMVRGVVVMVNDITANKRAEQALRESENRFRNMADTAPAMLWVVQGDGSASFLSQGWYEYTGQSEEQALGFGWLDAVHPEDRAESGRIFREANQKRVAFSIDYRLRRADGEYRWAIDAGRPRFAAEGLFLGFIGSVIDVHERKLVEQALRQSEAQLEAELADSKLLQRISAALIQEDGDAALYGKLVDAAAAIMQSDFASLQMYYPERGAAGELRLLAFRGFSPQAATFWQWVRADSQSICGESLRTRQRVVVSDVEQCDFMAGSEDQATCLQTGIRAVQTTPLLSRGGTLVGMISTHWNQPHQPSERDLRLLDILARQAADLIERRHAADRLRDSEQRFRSLVTATISVVWATDASGQFTEEQPSWMAYTGQTWEECGGFGWANAIHPDDREHVRALWEAALASGTLYKSEGRLWHAASKAYRRFVARGVPVLAADGTVREWVGKCMDTEQERQAEARIYSLMAELKDADRRKDEFLAMLAHELRGPLAPLSNMLSVMKQAGGDEQLLGQARDTMERQLAQVVRLVDDLLDISRITRDKLELRKDRIELASVVHQAVEVSRPLAERAQHQVTVSLPPEPIYLHADAVRLAQIFTNLLSNACKYTEPGGRISLTAQRQGSDVVVSVKDNGTGIPADKLESIFEMFTQMDRSLERSQGGLGIGLTLVQRLVEMHGGSISAHSDGEGAGSEFMVRLPVLLDQPKTPVGTSSASLPVLRRRVLVVDDNRDSAVSLAMLLKMTGNTTHTAHDGMEALEAAEKFLPEVVLLDIGLPKLSGHDVCRRIREQPWGKDMVIVALTGWGQDDDRRKSQEAGFNHHLVKPVDHAALMKLLASSPAELTPSGR